MPRIRKKTSNRAGTNDRKKVKNKIRESRKKKAKAAKKNPQWKSKLKKDPGIPNDFPYKDQILAEVAEQRRLAAEEKEQRKEEKKLLRKQAKGTSDNEEEDFEQENEEVEEEDSSKPKHKLDVGSDAIASLSAKIINPKLTTKKDKKAMELENVSDDDEAPVLVNHDLPNLKAVLDSADILLEVLDARDPLPFRSKYLEKVVEGKKILLVLNKIDTCPREALSAWLTVLRREHPTFLFKSASAFLPPTPESNSVVNGKGKAKVSTPKNDALGADAILNQLSEWATEKKDGPLNVAVVGLTNVGKSSFLNSLTHQAFLPIYTLATSSRGPTTTVLPQEVTVESNGKSIRFIDTCGLSWVDDDDDEEKQEAFRARDILLRSKGRIDRLKDPSPSVKHIVSRAKTEDLMVLYSLPAFSKGDPIAFLSGVARSNQLVKKRGELDLVGASKIVLRDWNSGRFARYTLPQDISVKSASATSTDINEGDEVILNQLRTKKEIRKVGGVGLVQLNASEIEERKVPLEVSWIDEESDDEVEDDGMEVVEDKEESGEDEEIEEDEEEEEEEEREPTPPPLTQKRKRSASFVSIPPSKKVAFAPKKQGKSVPTSEASVPEPKSILKKKESITKTKVKPSKPVKVQQKQKDIKKTPVRVANAPSISKQKVKDNKADPEAYDFSRFF